MSLVSRQVHIRKEGQSIRDQDTGRGLIGCNASAFTLKSLIAAYRELFEAPGL